MTLYERDELQQRLLQNVRQLRWGLEQIHSGANKAELVLSRTATAQKLLKCVESDTLALLGISQPLVETIATPNCHLGARRDR